MQGFALIEDFGEDTFSRVLSAGADEKALYLLAAEVLQHLHGHKQATDIDVPAHDMDTLLEGVMRFVDHFVPRVRGAAVTAAERRDFQTAWQVALKDVATRRETLVLRDYHVDNLMVVAGGTGMLRCGLLDFQDARIGSRAYDLMSLLEDARRRVSPQTIDAVKSFYFKGVGKESAAQIQADMAVLAAQRHTRVAGVFMRLSFEAGRPHYMRYMGRVLQLLDQALQRLENPDVQAVISDMVGDVSELDLEACDVAGLATGG